MLTPFDRDEWLVEMEFLDDGFCDSASSQGVLKLRYLIATENLSDGIRTLLADAQRLNIGISPAQAELSLYIKGDGEWETIRHPEGWRDLLTGLASEFGMWTYGMPHREVPKL